MAIWSMARGEMYIYFCLFTRYITILAVETQRRPNGSFEFNRYNILKVKIIFMHWDTTHYNTNFNIKIMIKFSLIKYFCHVKKN